MKIELMSASITIPHIKTQARQMPRQFLTTHVGFGILEVLNNLVK
jgi:hypothetical protein